MNAAFAAGVSRSAMCSSWESSSWQMAMTVREANPCRAVLDGPLSLGKPAAASGRRGRGLAFTLSRAVSRPWTRPLWTVRFIHPWWAGARPSRRQRPACPSGPGRQQIYPDHMAYRPAQRVLQVKLPGHATRAVGLDVRRQAQAAHSRSSPRRGDPPASEPCRPPLGAGGSALVRHIKSWSGIERKNHVPVEEMSATLAR